MTVVAFFQDYSVLWLFLALFILIYVAIIKINLPGNKFVLAVLSLLLSIMLISSDTVSNYMIQVIPLLTLILAAAFFIMLIGAFIIKDISTFTKPLLWLGIILAVLIMLCTALNSFPTMNHLLPNTTNTGLNTGLSEFKDYIYGSDFKDGVLFVVSIVIVGFFLLKK